MCLLGGKWNEVYRQFGYSHNGDFQLERHSLFDAETTCITYQCARCRHFKQSLIKGHVPSVDRVPEVFRKAFNEQ